MTQENRHLITIAQLCRAISLQLRHISTIGKKIVLNSNMSSTYPHNMVNIGPLTVEIVSIVWGNPAYFNGFRVFASLLHRRRLMEVNQTLHGVWPSPGLLYTVYTFLVALAPSRNFATCKIHFATKSCVLLS